MRRKILMYNDLTKELSRGFYAGHGFLRTPGSIQTAMMLAAIIIQSSQNCYFGGQSLANVDYAFAPYVLKTYKKHLKNNYIFSCKKNNSETNENIIKNINELKSMDEIIDNLKRVRKGAMFIIEAPSGTGKSAVVKELLARDSNIKFSVSVTTRQKRPGEVDGVDYGADRRQVHFGRRRAFGSACVQGRQNGS